MNITIVHNEKEKRFSAIDNETELGYLTYTVKENTMNIEHTVVTPEHRGKGIGSMLVDAACDYSVKSKFILVSSCSFAAKPKK